MNKHLAAAVIALCFLVPVGAFANSNAPAAPEKSPCASAGGCTQTKTVRVRGELTGYKTVPVYAYHNKTVKVKAPCCEKQQPVTVEEPAPETIVVKKKVYVVEQPEIVRIPAPPIIVHQRPVCCPRPNMPCGAQVPLTYAGAGIPSLATQVNWTPQGKSDLCLGKPKGVAFSCTSPSSGRETSCMCN